MPFVADRLNQQVSVIVRMSSCLFDACIVGASWKSCMLVRRRRNRRRLGHCCRRISRVQLFYSNTKRPSEHAVGFKIELPFAGCEIGLVLGNQKARFTTCREGAHSSKISTCQIETQLEFQTCRCGGIGRRDGFKIHWGQPRGGSSPLAGTF